MASPMNLSTNPPDVCVLVNEIGGEANFLTFRGYRGKSKGEIVVDEFHDLVDIHFFGDGSEVADVGEKDCDRFTYGIP